MQDCEFDIQKSKETKDNRGKRNSCAHEKKHGRHYNVTW